MVDRPPRRAPGSSLERVTRWAWLLGSAAVLGPAWPSSAPAEPPPTWLEGEDATGEWGGARPWLDAHGVHLDLDYTAESFALLGGGPDDVRQAFRGTLDLLVVLDTEALSLWPGGTLLVYGQHGHGDGLSDDLGLAMQISNLEAPAFTQLAELWYEQDLLDGALRLRLGKQDANRDFAAPRFPGNFVHSSYGAPLNLPMPTFPAPALGAVVFVEPRSWLSLRSGVYEGSAQVGSIGIDSGWAASDPFGLLAAVMRHAVGGERPDAARYEIGAWYQEADVVGAGQIYSNNFGAYASADVLLPADGDRSAQAFVRVGWAPADRNRLGLYVAGGATYHGIRGDDTLGLGAGHVSAATSGTQNPAESFVELFYKARLTDWYSVQPDLQLILTPQRSNGAALVAGVRVKLKL